MDTERGSSSHGWRNLEHVLYLQNRGLELQKSNAIRPPFCCAIFQISFLTKQRQHVRDNSRRLLVKHTYKQAAQPRSWAQCLPLD